MILGGLYQDKILYTHKDTKQNYWKTYPLKMPHKVYDYRADTLLAFHFLLFVFYFP